jgi:hypothetical protein
MTLLTFCDRPTHMREIRPAVKAPATGAASRNHGGSPAIASTTFS